MYLGASSCIYFLAHDVFILMFFFYGMYMLWGDIIFFISFIVSCFTCVTLAIDLYYEVIHDICLLLSTRAFMCLLSVTGIYKLILSCYCLYWQLIDSS